MKQTLRTVPTFPSSFQDEYIYGLRKEVDAYKNPFSFMCKIIILKEYVIQFNCPLKLLSFFSENGKMIHLIAIKANYAGYRFQQIHWRFVCLSLQIQKTIIYKLNWSLQLLDSKPQRPRLLHRETWIYFRIWELEINSITFLLCHLPQIILLNLFWHQTSKFKATFVCSYRFVFLIHHNHCQIVPSLFGHTSLRNRSPWRQSCCLGCIKCRTMI